MTAEAPTAPAPPYGRLVPVTVHFDDLDALGLLHNARYPVLVERAWGALWQESGFGFTGDWEAAGDACNAVKELRVTYDVPVTTAGEYAVHLWLERLG
ncbi:acyl-CoA thioesterase, partial [Streptomyces minutiscleroticus]